MVVRGFGTVVSDGTEQALLTSNLNGSFIFIVSLKNMASGNVTTLRMYQKVLPSGALELAYQQQFTGVISPDTVAPSVPMPSDQQAQFTLQCTGPAAQFDWKVGTL